MILRPHCFGHLAGPSIYKSRPLWNTVWNADKGSAWGWPGSPGSDCHCWTWSCIYFNTSDTLLDGCFPNLPHPTRQPTCLCLGKVSWSTVTLELRANEYQDPTYPASTPSEGWQVAKATRWRYPPPAARGLLPLRPWLRWTHQRDAHDDGRRLLQL